MTRLTYPKIVFAFLAFANMSACTTPSTTPLPEHLCERASQITADAQTILETRAAMGITGGKADTLLALIRQGRVVLSATCQILTAG